MRRLVLVVTVLTLAVALLACSNQNAPGVSSSETQKGNAVSIKDNTFSPVNLETPVSQEVKFVNNDTVPHQLVAEDGSFDSGTIAEGKVFRFAFSKAGTYKYRCTLHSYASEAGTVIVK